jgi:hypothetical protein
MTSIREQILAVLTTTLGSTSGVTAVYRSRADYVERFLLLNFNFM